MNPAVYLYIHIPFCISKCHYCDFFSIADKDFKLKGIQEDYIDALCNEIKFRCKVYLNQKKSKYCGSIYIGGGTPSLLSKNQLEKISEAIKSVLLIDKHTEITIEVNPDDVTADFLQNIRSVGINRISCGIQTMNDNSLKFVNRRADKEKNLQALELFSKNWTGKLSLDLISALPQETIESFEKSLKTVLSYNPHHISMYSLTIEEETFLGQKLQKGEFDYDFNFADEMWLQGREILLKNGYRQYEVSNFCKDGEECVHNLSYWNHFDYIGCGSGGCGSVYNFDGSGIRWSNTQDLCKYINFWKNENNSFFNSENLNSDFSQITALLENLQLVDSETITIELSKYEFFMMGLRKLTGVTDKEYEKCFLQPFPPKVKQLFEQWEKKSLAEITFSKNDNSTRYNLNNQGILFLNSFLTDLEF